MITKIKDLKGQIDCPYCFSLLQWDQINDIKVSNGNQYIVCPECGQSIVLDPKRDYWKQSKDNDGQEQTNSNVVVVDALSRTEQVDGEEVNNIMLMEQAQTLFNYAQHKKIIIGRIISPLNNSFLYVLINQVSYNDDETYPYKFCFMLPGEAQEGENFLMTRTQLMAKQDTDYPMLFPLGPAS